MSYLLKLNFKAHFLRRNATFLEKRLSTSSDKDFFEMSGLCPQNVWITFFYRDDRNKKAGVCGTGFR